MDNLAKELDIHKVSVWRIAKHLGITWKHKPNHSTSQISYVDIEEIVKYYEDGHTLQSIATIFNTHVNVIGKKLRKYYGRGLHPSLHSGICKRCGKQFNQDDAIYRYQRKYTLTCLDCYNKLRIRIARRVKMRVIEGYGGKCQCHGCDITIPEFLTIDHIHGRKITESRRFNGISTYYRLIREGFPKGEVQLMCMNCNFAKGMYGVCPHTKIN